MIRLSAGRRLQQISSIETALGYDGFLKVYRNYRLTGDAAAPSQLNRKAAAANVAIGQLQELYASDAGATDALREAHAVTETFAQIARTAPQMGPVALRGTAAMDALGTLPQTPQLETAYLSLRSALDRLKQAEQAHQLGGIAAALSWSQMLILGALASLVTGLLVVAGLLHLGIINPLKLLERSLVSLGDGNVGQRVWGTERKDEIGEVARAGEKLRLSLTETSALKSLAENSQLRVTLEGQGSVLFEKLAADVTSAAEALKGASADLAKLQTRDRQEIDAALATLNQASAGAGRCRQSVAPRRRSGDPKRSRIDRRIARHRQTTRRPPRPDRRPFRARQQADGIGGRGHQSQHRPGRRGIRHRNRLRSNAWPATPSRSRAPSSPVATRFPPTPPTPPTRSARWRRVSPTRSALSTRG